MFIQRIIHPIKQFPGRIQGRVNRFGAQYSAYGLFGTLNAPLYYLIWLYVAKESYENLSLRLLCGVLCIVLVFHQYWPRSLKFLLPLYWYLTLLITLPFFFTILLLLNHGSPMWMANNIVMVFLMLLLVDTHSAIVLLVLGTGLGAAGLMLWQHDIISLLHLMEYRGFLVTYGISLVIGTLFSYNREHMETLKRKVIQAEAECQEKSAFIANISHDLRTPLSALLSLTEVTAQQFPSNHPLQTTFSMMQQSTRQLQQLLEQLLESAQLHQGNNKIHIEIFTMETLLREIGQLFRPALQQKSLIFSTNTKKSISTAKGPAVWIRRILIHLVSNAIKFTDQGSIAIEVELLAKSQLQIKVIDTGCGIAKAQQSTIFKSFKKIIPSYQQSDYQGAGLGLYLVHQMITQISGSITVDSAGPGQGSTFIATIPVEHAPQDQRVLPIPQKNQTKSISGLALQRILLVEDNKVVQLTTQKFLQQQQPQAVIDTTETVAGAIQFACQQHYDLILLDIGLPDGSGNEAAQHIRTLTTSHNQTTPIIAVTAHVDTAHRDLCLQAGINHVINKPLTGDKWQFILKLLLPVKQICQSQL